MVISGVLSIVEVVLYAILVALLGTVGKHDSSYVELYISSLDGPFMRELERTEAPALPSSGAHTYFVVHGFTQAYDVQKYPNITETLVARGNVVINVQWQELAASPNYFNAVGNLRTVAAVVASYIKRHGMDPSAIKLVGFSLGAHVAGFIGKEFTTTKIDTIIGLDPAGPLFGLLSPVPAQFRLSAGDADMVVTLATNRGHLGTAFNLGRVNFRANGGEHQVGCHNAENEDFCCHELSVDYYYYSLLSTKFVGVNPNNPSDRLCFGYNIPANAAGLYVFTTTATEPYN